MDCIVFDERYPYYSNRWHQINVVDHGVPQGSILGPILVIIFLNNICRKIFYVDDIYVLVTHKNLEDLVHLGYQTSKEFIKYCNSSTILKQTHTSIFESDLEYNETVRFLGLALDE